MLFTDLLKEDLVKAARYYKVEVEPNWTKDRIATALLDAGKTPEQWERDQEANDFGEGNGAITTSDLGDHPEPETEESDEDTESVEDEPVVEDEPAEEDEELVLVRFTGSNQSYTTGPFTFSRFKPFGLMTEEQFDTLDRNKFRLATKAEAVEFYGH